MIKQGVFLADGSSDEPMGEHLEYLCALRNVDVQITTPDLRRLSNPPGHRVADRLNAIFDIGMKPDIVFVHRDAEKQNPSLRYKEVQDAVDEVDHDLLAVAVVPVRMTEAWLLIDEGLIRHVAKRPHATDDLGLPPISKIEDHPDPKKLLQDALSVASGLQGRRLDRFQRQFSNNRRTLLQRLDVNGPVRNLPSWKALESTLDRIVAPLGDADAGSLS